MTQLSKIINHIYSPFRLRVGLAFLLTLLLAGVVHADAPNRTPPRGTVPNPGTQEQELANITMPAPYNVFEFVVTCAACHGGSIDQNTGHFGNWAGTSMASAARDPIFRANQVIVNETIKGLTGEDGAGNMCFRCHSPNGWYSGRFDPQLGGAADGSTMLQSILASTDTEGIMCEFCHRVIGNVTVKDPQMAAQLDAFGLGDQFRNDPVWKMMAGISDWPHAGNDFPQGPKEGMPYGDTTLQINDGMTYGGKYPGSVDMFFSDVPMQKTDGTLTNYTGQTYGIYPPGWPSSGVTNVLGQMVAISPDGSTPIHFEVPIGPPVVNGVPDYQAQSISLEHPTFDGEFIRSSEFCGSCHDLTVPVLNHGMPEQRTYTEWKFSAFGTEGSADFQRCQDCHMPTMKHEYADNAAVSLNPDPTLTGWFPYAKDRNPTGGTAFHKFNGSNRDLPDMMKILYPEVDLEVIGAPTGNDTRVFPGMLSDRSTMWDRAKRNSEVGLNDAVTTAIVNDAVEPIGTAGTACQVRVRVNNNTGHRIPSGYPDGRRMWLSLEVTDGQGNLAYQSGVYDSAQAMLSTDATHPFNRAVSRIIDARNPDNNAVMVYEKVTGTCTATGCTPSPNLLNDTILFDNRIPPKGFSYADYSANGTKFITYDPVTYLPSEDPARYPDGLNRDIVVYRFKKPASVATCGDLNARAEVYWQTHNREFMEHLKNSDTSTVRPEGPPSIYEPNYPLTPNYLSDVIGLNGMTDMDGQPLRDNWGGIAYAAWLLTGKGEPFLSASADTTVPAKPATPAGVSASVVDPFTIDLNWIPQSDAEGYIIWVRYGKSNATASWDKLAVVQGSNNTTFRHEALNVAKTYSYQVQAYNAKGKSTRSAAVLITTPIDLPLPPENLRFVPPAQPNAITMSWIDTAENETEFVIQRQDVPVVADFVTVATIPSQTPGLANGGNIWTDTTVLPGMTYNYRVAAQNASGMSTWSLPAQGQTSGVANPPTMLTAIAVSGQQVDLAWDAGTGTLTGYSIQRSDDGGVTWLDIGQTAADVLAFSDLTVQPFLTYSYRVFAMPVTVDSLPSPVATVTTPSVAPAAPSNLDVWGASTTQIDLVWADNATIETGFIVERSTDGGATWVEVGQAPANATSFSDTTVEPKMTYSYQVVAFLDAGPTFGIVRSAPSNQVTVVTPGEIPQPPSNLQIIRRDRTSLRMRWTDNSNNEEGFNIERSTDGGATWTWVASVGINQTVYTDNGLSRKTTYWYRVQAFNADGVSAYTDPPASAATK